MSSLLVLLIFICLPSVAAQSETSVPQQMAENVVTAYHAIKDKTTVSHAPVQIGGPNGKYHSIHMAPAYSYPGKEPRTPELLDFELRTVVKGKLRIDLYVLFIVDGEKIFLSSSRRAVRKGDLGRGWMGEHLVFRMPYETFLKLTRARSVEVTFDGLSFPVGEEQMEVLREFARSISGVPEYGC